MSELTTRHDEVGYPSYPSYPSYPNYPGYRTDFEEPALKRYLGVLRQRIWFVLTAFVVISTVGIFQAFRAIPIYQATSQILVETQAPRVLKFEDVSQSQGAYDPDYYMKTQKQLALSRAVLEIALAQPDIREMFADKPDTSRPTVRSEASRTLTALMGDGPSPTVEAWEKLRGCLRISQVQGTQILEVSVMSSNPTTAARLSNAVAEAFIQYHIEARQQASSGAFRFLEEEKGKEEQKLLKTEEALQQFREKTKLVSLDSADKDNPILARLRRLDEQLTRTQLDRIELESQVQVVKQAVGAGGKDLQSGNDLVFTLPALRADQAVGNLRSDLVAAEKEYATLSDVYGPDHPQLRAALIKVNLLKEKIQAALSPLLASLSVQLDMLKRQEQELQQGYDQQNQVALDLARQSQAYQRIQNEAERQGKLFDVLVERMREVDLTSDYTVSNVKLVDKADIPKSPVSPNRPRTILIWMFMSLFVGVSVALVLDYLDDTIKTPDDLQVRAGVPVLGFVPNMKGKLIKKGGFPYRALVAMTEPASSATEAYRNIRTNLFFSAPAEENKVLTVTSGGPSDGKTTTSCNLALVMAQSGKRVLLIDADMRKPMIHRAMGLGNKVGLSSVLVGACKLDEAVQKPKNNGHVVEHLDILSAGPRSPNPAELLDSQSMRNLLEEARGKYDRVIVDTPPVLFVADASIISAMSDGVVMVLKSARSTRTLVSRTREQLEGVNARIVGGILNDVRVSRWGYYYSSYYYSYYYRYHYDYARSYYGSRKDEVEEAQEGAGKP